MKLIHVYRLSGLDRVLYSSDPQWPGGSYRALDSEKGEGELTLVATDIATPEALRLAQAELHERAEKFRLAISYRIGCPLVLKLQKEHLPDVDRSGVLAAKSTIQFTATLEATVLPNTPPAELPQLPIASAGWVQTLAEIQKFWTFQDEVLKRLYLIVEELWPRFSAQASEQQRQVRDQAKLLRDFVSHPQCESRQVVEFIAANLPSAVASLNGKQVVRFDRTDIEHRNFLGRFEPEAKMVACWLIDLAIQQARDLERAS